jgi:hypothetical protein
LLLDSKAVLSANAYVDLNPVKADMFSELEAAECSSLRYRLDQLKDSVSDQIPFQTIYPSHFENSNSQKLILMKFDVGSYVEILRVITAQFLGKPIGQGLELRSLPDLDHPLSFSFAMGNQQALDQFAAKRSTKRAYRRRSFKEYFEKRSGS